MAVDCPNGRNVAFCSTKVTVDFQDFYTKPTITNQTNKCIAYDIGTQKLTSRSCNLKSLFVCEVTQSIEI